MKCNLYRACTLFRTVHSCLGLAAIFSTLSSSRRCYKINSARQKYLTQDWDSRAEILPSQLQTYPLHHVLENQLTFQWMEGLITALDKGISSIFPGPLDDEKTERIERRRNQLQLIRSPPYRFSSVPPISPLLIAAHCGSDSWFVVIAQPTCSSAAR